jgi:hypothetical protein
MTEFNELEDLAEKFREAMGRRGAHTITILPHDDPDPNESEWVRTMRALLSKRVVVTLNDDASVRVRGVLLAFTDYGDVCVMDPDTGETTWGWPNLHIAELPDPEAEPSRWFSCPHGCGEMLAKPPHGDREDAMRPHLSSCIGLRG